MHATSNGKVLLSALERSEVARQVPALRAYTANTITTLDGLMRELEEVRQRGFAIAIDELEIGLTAVAAPVRNIHGEVMASLSISGPTFRLDARRVPQMTERWSWPPRRCRAGWGGADDRRRSRRTRMDANRHEIETCRVLTNCGRPTTMLLRPRMHVAS